VKFVIFILVIGLSSLSFASSKTPGRKIASNGIFDKYHGKYKVSKDQMKVCDKGEIELLPFSDDNNAFYIQKSNSDERELLSVSDVNKGKQTGQGRELFRQFQTNTIFKDGILQVYEKSCGGITPLCLLGIKSNLMIHMEFKNNKMTIRGQKISKGNYFLFFVSDDLNNSLSCTYDLIK
jgi:hypothetical protein